MRVVYEDSRDLENVREVALVELLGERALGERRACVAISQVLRAAGTAVARRT